MTLGALILNGAVAWFYDHKQWEIHLDHQTQIEAIKKEIMEARRLAISVTQTATLRAQMQAFVDAHEATMVSGDQFAWVIREISQLAESQPVSNVTTQPGSLTPHARKPTRQWYITHLEFVGSYDQIGLFVQELENHFPEGEIRSLSLQATEAPAVHRAALDLALLVRPVVAPPGAPEPPKSQAKS